MDRLKKYFRFMLIIPLALILFGCTPEKTSYKSFADYPGFEEYYRGRCPKGKPLPSTGEVDRALLYKYRPRLILPPGGNYPIDFYRDYLPCTIMRSYADKVILAEEVTPEILKMNQDNQRVYLDLQLDRYRVAGLDRKLQKKDPQKSDPEKKPAVYGRVHREIVEFPNGKNGRVSRNLTFLKYNVVFALSGLPASLPGGYETLLRLIGLDPDDWHQLDNFVAIHVVLDGKENPIAAILAQHNHHQTYLIGKDIGLPADGRMVFDIALRSNEVYPDSNDAGPVKHRVIPWVLYLKYLLSREDPPLFRGYDLTYGVPAGGREISYDLAFLSPCDPFIPPK